MKIKYAIFVLSMFCLILILGCSANKAENNTQIANPASKYCIEHGGQLEIRSDAQGNQYGICIFPDKSECDEWAYFRGECAPGAVQ